MAPLTRQSLVRRPWWPACWVATVVSLYRWFKAHGIAVAHANTINALPYCGPAARLARIPCVTHLRDAKRFRCIAPLLSVWCDQFIAPSRFIARRARESNVSERKVRVIPNGVALEPFLTAVRDDALRERLGVSARQPVVLMVAQITPWKRQHVFLLAAAKVHAQRPDIRFWIAGRPLWRGDQRYLRLLKAMVARLGLQRAVRFLGHVPDPHRYLASADVVVLPSVGEPFGRVIAEAMAAGTPVVASASGAIPEIIDHGDTGLLFEPDRPEHCARAILRLIGEPKLADALAARARNVVQSKFSIERCVSELRRLYDELFLTPSTATG